MLYRLLNASDFAANFIKACLHLIECIRVISKACAQFLNTGVTDAALSNNSFLFNLKTTDNLLLLGGRYIKPTPFQGQ